ncbi:MAG: enoyl-CoA hydratase/isomerase family protein [Solirubrobacteraceae bacterium]
MSEQSENGGYRLPWYVDVPVIQRWIARLESEGNGEEAWERVRLWTKMVDEHGVVNVSVEGRVGVVALSYPPKGNALVPPMYRMIVAAMEDLSANEDVWVILIKGTGKNFSTGGYVGPDAFYAGLDSGEEGTTAEPMRRTLVDLFQPAPKSIYETEKPTIAMVNGLVMAESIDLALAADLRTGSEATQFRFSFAATGNTAYTGAAWSLPRLIGLSRARQFLMTADAVEGRRAHEAGLLNYLFDDASLEQESMAIAQRIASLPPVTQRLIKKELKLGLGIDTYAAAIDTYAAIEPIVQFTEDHMDAERAVVEKRAPMVRGY